MHSVHRDINYTCCIVVHVVLGKHTETEVINLIDGITVQEMSNY